MNIQPRYLNMVYTYSCNASCRHCCFSCSPDRTEKMDINFAKEIIYEASMIPSINNISLSGGEIFLYIDEIISLIHYIKLNKFIVSCNTNGYWGKNRENADKVMRRLRSLNVSLLSVSYDFFHKEFIPVSALQNIIEFAKKYDVNMNLKGVVFKGNPNIFQLMDEFEYVINDIPVIANNCLRVGRAEYALDERNFIYNEPRNRRCNSLGRDITIYPDGNVRPCCSPIMNTDYFGLGNLQRMSLESTLKNLYSNEQFLKLVKYGFPKTKREDKLSIQSLCDICRNYFERGID